MDKICDLRLETVEESQWIRIKQVNYKQNGVDKKQEIICSHDSCGILIHNTSRDVFVFVRQFRPAVFMHEVGWETLSLNSSECLSPSDEHLQKGFTLELCAGILDKEDKTLVEIAAEEVLEECGYRINSDDLEPILATRNNSLHSGTLQNLFYVKVTDDMKAEGWGGGNEEEGEFIEIVEFKVSDLLASLFDDSLPKPIGLTFALVWFLFTKTSSSPLKLPPNGHYPPETDESNSNNSSNDKGKKRTSKESGKTPSKNKKPRLEKDDDGNDKSKCHATRLVVTDVQVSDTRTAKELQIYRLRFKQKDFQRAWDFFYVQSVCTTLVHNVSRNVFLLVRRFSPAVYGSLYQRQRLTGAPETVSPSDACLTQLCASNFERGHEPCTVASDSVLKTFGYEVPSKDFKRILRSRSNVGIAGALLTLFYVKVTDEMKVKDPLPDERDFDVIEVPVTRDNDDDDSVVDGLQMLMLQGKNPMSLSLALLWYYYQSSIGSRSSQ